MSLPVVQENKGLGLLVDEAVGVGAPGAVGVVVSTITLPLDEYGLAAAEVFTARTLTYQIPSARPVAPPHVVVLRTQLVDVTERSEITPVVNVLSCDHWTS